MYNARPASAQQDACIGENVKIINILKLVLRFAAGKKPDSPGALAVALLPRPVMVIQTRQRRLFKEQGARRSSGPPGPARGVRNCRNL
jgi:hypothetical protein